MKLSIFTTVGDWLKRGDPFIEAIENYTSVADEVVIVDGSEKTKEIQSWNEKVKIIHSPWPQDFDWTVIGDQFQKGYDACTGDWCIRMDLDYFLNVEKADELRERLSAIKSIGATLHKWQFLVVDRYRLKARMAIAMRGGDKDITFHGGADECQAQYKGEDLSNINCEDTRIEFYNYDHSFKTKEQLRPDLLRFARAWQKHFGIDRLGAANEREAMRNFMDMQIGRYAAMEWKHIPLEEHPKEIRERLSKIRADQFGFNMFGALNIYPYQP